MSAECSKCGTDIVYPEGSWPVGECPVCKKSVEVITLDLACRCLADVVRFEYGEDRELAEIAAGCDVDQELIDALVQVQDSWFDEAANS